MPIRRVVLGLDEDGRSVVQSDEVAGRQSVFQTVPGFEVHLLWSTESSAKVGGRAAFKDPTVAASFLPGPGESRLMIVHFPPDAVMLREDFDGAAFGAELMQLLPGLAQTFEPDAPAMHTTDSIDYDVVLEGEICLELDDGREVLLRRHDVSIQQGNRHAWRNRSDQPAKMLFVLMGTQRAG